MHVPQGSHNVLIITGFSYSTVVPALYGVSYMHACYFWKEEEGVFSSNCFFVYKRLSPKNNYYRVYLEL